MLKQVRSYSKQNMVCICLIQHRLGLEIKYRDLIESMSISWGKKQSAAHCGLNTRMIRIRRPTLDNRYLQFTFDEENVILRQRADFINIFPSDLLPNALLN